MGSVNAPNKTNENENHVSDEQVNTHARTQAPILQSTLQLVLLSSISDEELTQTIGVICSSMGGGGLACSTAMNAPNSLPALHRWCLAACLKFKFMSRRQPRKEKKVARASLPHSQTDRQASLMETLLLFPAIDVTQGKV